MIDWDKTKKETGINKEYFDKFPKSGKKVITICDNCGKIRLLPFGSYKKVCKSCIYLSKEFRDKMSKLQQGKNNSNYKKGKIKVFCSQCGKEDERYPSEVSNLNFCCKKCHDEYQVGKNNPGYIDKIIIICEQCGIKYECLPSITETSKFCSEECQYEWLAENLKGKNGSNWKGRKIKLICEQCEKEFEKFPSQISRFCSMNCYLESLPNKIEHTCKQCGETFYCKPSYGDVLFCDETCYGLWRSENISGENHYNYGKKLSEETCQRKSASMQGISYEEWDGFVTEDWRDWSKVIYLNDPFDGCHRHHITETMVICIPSELHNHISHNLKKNTNMTEVNILALQYINGYYEEYIVGNLDKMNIIKE